MKLTSNIERPITQAVRMNIEEIRKKKTQIMMATLFLLGSFFLAQAVLFDAAVPFSCLFGPWRLRAFRKYLIWVFIGGIAGSAFLGVGQAVIHLFQLGLFNTVIRHRICSKVDTTNVVALCILLFKFVWQLIMYAGKIPLEIQLMIGYEVILALFMTFFLFVAFPPD